MRTSNRAVALILAQPLAKQLLHLVNDLAVDDLRALGGAVLLEDALELTVGCAERRPNFSVLRERRQLVFWPIVPRHLDTARVTLT